MTHYAGQLRLLAARPIDPIDWSGRDQVTVPCSRQGTVSLYFPNASSNNVGMLSKLGERTILTWGFFRMPAEVKKVGT